MFYAITFRQHLAFVLGCLLCQSTFGADLVLKAGAATSNITPAIGGNIVGGFAPSPSANIHDELHARCLVLDDGKQRIAFVVCDLLGMQRSVSTTARRLITEKTAIPPSHVLISATHTHSATSVLGTDRFEAEAQLDEYQMFVARRIADGVVRAVKTLRPVEIAYGEVDVPSHVFNRRWYMRAGSMPVNPFGEYDQVKMNPPAGSPNLTEPAGPTDPTVRFWYIRQLDKTPVSLFAAYSLHYVGGVGRDDISADYYGEFCDAITRKLTSGPLDIPFVPMLANGTSGDINNINFRTPRPAMKPYEQIQNVARDVAAKVYEATEKLTYHRNISLDARYAEPVIQIRRPSPERIAWANKQLETSPVQAGKVDLSSIYAERTLKLAKAPESTTIPVQAFRVGDVYLGTMPCEVFCEIGLEFRDRAPQKMGFMVSLNHGYFGYLPTPRHHDLGGYETWIGTNVLERTASEKLLDQLQALVSEMETSKPSK